MGQFLSAQQPLSEEDERAFLPLLTARETFVISEDALYGLDVQVRPAKCEKTMYVPTHRYGLFATRDIKANEIIISNDNPLATGANDAMMDLRPFLNASSASEMEKAFHDAREKYYDSQTGEQRVNAILIYSPEIHKMALKARRFIAKGEEILRVYGFSTWIKDIAELNLLSLRM